ncbi:MAG TPA: 4-hydroxybenzoate octaprenyltransferase [Rhodocyclaceae bacterium]|nr:4-hydroxybenzoate octaprenyltransferase [Rhodocyclaceae bacterium]
MTLSELKNKLDAYERLMRLDKPIGILLLLWPTLWALWAVSYGWPSFMVLAIFVLGTVLMRSAGCVINDYADRDFDGHVERTRHRPLATREVSTKEALWLAASLSLLAFLLILPLNKMVLLLSLPALFLAGSYPFTKRFLAIPQAYLGVAFGFGIPMAYATFLGTVPPTAWLMLAANVFWAIAYDTEYAMVDREDDLKLGIKTSAITFGRYDVAAVMCCYAMTLGLLAWFGQILHYGIFYYASLVVAAAIVTYHYTLIRHRERDKCFKAFLHNTWIGAVIFLGFVAELNLKPHLF